MSSPRLSLSPSRNLPLLLPLLAALGATSAACGGDDDDGGDVPDAGGNACAAEDPTPPVFTAECDGATWIGQNASHTAGTISHTSALAITPGGTEMVAWTEPPAVGELFDEDLFVSTRCPSWSEAQPITSDTAVQNAYPSLAVEGETVHMVWNGYPEGNNDVYYSVNDGTGWTARVNLTMEYEGGAMRHAYDPSLAMGPSGQMAIAYLSAPASESGGFAGPGEVRVALLDGGALTGEPVTVIPSMDDGCFDPTAVYDADGVLHVVADCGNVLAEQEDVYHATDGGTGDWTEAAPLPGNDADLNDMSPSMSLGGDGVLRVAWVQGDAIVVATWDGASFGDPVPAATGGALWPSIAAGADGTVVLAFHQRNADNWVDVFVTTSADGSTFSEPCNLTSTPDADESSPTSMQIDPRTGAAHFTFDQTLKGSDPLDLEIIHMEQAPP